MQNRTEALTMPSVNSGLDDLSRPFSQSPHADEPGFEPNHFAGDRADDDTENDDEGILRKQGHFEPDDQHAEAEPLKDDGTDTFRQAGSEGKPHKAADGDAQSVDDGPERDHARVSPLPYRFSHSPISFLASARNSGNTACTSSERPIFHVT